MALHWSGTGIEVHKHVVRPIEGDLPSGFPDDFDNNVFTIRCTETGEAMLIDAANEHERLLEVCQALGVTKVVETHGHWDHIQAVPAIRDAGIEVGITAEDSSMLPSYDFILEDDSVIEVGRLRIRTIHNPGHTAGSMSFHIVGTPLLFTGDTLFPGGPGATGFGGDFDQIIRSIEDRMFSAFGGDTMVLPGHGLDTTIGNESPHLQEWIDRGW
ncbi:MBL fold metallo-hydrolase [Candidatus Poriferisodalis sp.]|uniref:MBL fold metallo-hydrolase n=1 Tax=Candidatus Poriferisodalis sp. TaxID=3101277 RepID=UPI003B5A0A69